MEKLFLVWFVVSCLTACIAADTPASITFGHKVVSGTSITLDVVGADTDGVKGCEYAVYASGETPRYTAFGSANCGTLNVTQLTPNTIYTVSVRLESLNIETNEYVQIDKATYAITKSTLVNLDLIEDASFRECLENHEIVHNETLIEDVTNIICIFVTPLIASIKGIEQFTHLHSTPNWEDAWLNYDSLRPFDRLYEIGGVTLDATNLSDLSPLAEIDGLDLVIIHGDSGASKDIDFSVLSKLKDLKMLVVQGFGEKLTSIEWLSELTKIKYLMLPFNQISDISVLSNLTELVDLRLTNNRIDDISSLENLTKLDALIIRDNKIRDISALTELTNLSSLELNGNNISCPDFEALMAQLRYTIITGKEDACVLAN